MKPCLFCRRNYGRQIKLKYDFKIIKAFGISSSKDLDELVKYEPFVEYFLLDSPPQANVQGGTGHRFDWKIIENLSITSIYFDINLTIINFHFKVKIFYNKSYILQ